MAFYGIKIMGLQRAAESIVVYLWGIAGALTAMNMIYRGRSSITGCISNSQFDNFGQTNGLVVNSGAEGVHEGSPGSISTYNNNVTVNTVTREEGHFEIFYFREFTEQTINSRCNTSLVFPIPELIPVSTESIIPTSTERVFSVSLSSFVSVIESNAQYPASSEAYTTTSNKASVSDYDISPTSTSAVLASVLRTETSIFVSASLSASNSQYPASSEAYTTTMSNKASDSYDISPTSTSAVLASAYLTETSSFVTVSYCTSNSQYPTTSEAYTTTTHDRTSVSSFYDINPTSTSSVLTPGVLAVTTQLIPTPTPINATEVPEFFDAYYCCRVGIPVAVVLTAIVTIPIVMLVCRYWDPFEVFDHGVGAGLDSTHIGMGER